MVRAFEHNESTFIVDNGEDPAPVIPFGIGLGRRQQKTTGGWSLNCFGKNELLAEVADAYFDLRRDFGPVGVALRLGKERLENGNEIDRLFRVTNVIDSLDFRRDILFPDPFGSIDSFVIGQWRGRSAGSREYSKSGQG